MLSRGMCFKQWYVINSISAKDETALPMSCSHSSHLRSSLVMTRHFALVEGERGAQIVEEGDFK